MKLLVNTHNHGEYHVHVFACPEGVIPTEVDNSPFQPTHGGIDGSIGYEFEVSDEFYHSLSRKCEEEGRRMTKYVRNCWSCKYSADDNDGNTLCIHSKHDEQTGGFIIIDFELATNTCEDYEEIAE